MLSLDRLSVEETPESIETWFDLECQEPLETKISPCLYRSPLQTSQTPIPLQQSAYEPAQDRGIFIVPDALVKTMHF